MPFLKCTNTLKDGTMSLQIVISCNIWIYSVCLNFALQLKMSSSDHYATFECSWLSNYNRIYWNPEPWSNWSPYYTASHQHFGSDVTSVSFAFKWLRRHGATLNMRSADTLRRKYGTSIDFMWHHYQSTCEMPYRSMVATTAVVCMILFLFLWGYLTNLLLNCCYLCKFLPADHSKQINKLSFSQFTSSF